jgi:hypothetical protein
MRVAEQLDAVRAAVRAGRAWSAIANPVPDGRPPHPE